MLHQMLFTAAAMLVAAAQAQTNTSPASPQPDARPNLYRSGALIASDLADWATCLQRARDDARARNDYAPTYRCDPSGTSLKVLNAVAPPPTCPAAPAPQTRQTACPVGTGGFYTQSRTATVGQPTACPVTWSDWLPAAPPAGACPPAPPPPPTPPPPTGSYDVAARLAAFNARLQAVRPGAAAWQFALPAAPTIISRRTVSTAAEMQAAMGTPGVEVTFAGSGIVGTLAPRANQRWIFPAGFTLNGSVNVDRTNNVELVGTGGRVNGQFIARQVTDLRMRGLEVASPQTNNVDQSQRVLIEGSYLSAPSYAMIYADNRDIVFANSEFHAGGAAATHRGARNTNALLIDSRLVNAGSQQQVRQHAASPNFAAFNLQIEGGTGAYFGSAGDGCPSVRDLVFLDNSYYGQGDTIFTDGCVAGGTVVGNRGFSPWGSGSQVGVNMPAGSMVQDNPRLPYQAPPSWARR